MKIFISFRFTGEDMSELKGVIRGIEEALHAAGHETVCSVWEEEKFTKERFTPRQILEWALRELDSADTYLAFVKSTERSEGMLLEAGYALAKGKRFIVAVRRDITTTFLRHIADTIIEYDSYGDLYAKLRNLK
ncbi:MAG: nucleoside 2-deoxyribosyltransferase [bacterium]|nr:nucleoside 2-deoxyribosyltransferase [bacterium]